MPLPHGAPPQPAHLCTSPHALRARGRHRAHQPPRGKKYSRLKDMKSVVLTMAYEPQPHWFYSCGIVTILRSSLKIHQYEGCLGDSSWRTLSPFPSLPPWELVLGPPNPSLRSGKGALGKPKSAPTAQSPPVAPCSLRNGPRVHTSPHL